MKTITSILLLAVMCPAWGQEYFSIEHITEKDGLSFRDVKDIYRTDRDFLWVTTANGLNRFDGVNWEHFLHPNTSSTPNPTNDFEWITEDSAGNLILVMRNGALSYFNKVTKELHFKGLLAGDSMRIIGSPFQTHLGEILTVGTNVKNELYLLKYKSQGQFERVRRLQNSDTSEMTGWYSKLWSGIQFIGGSADDFWYWDETSYIRFQPSQSIYTHYLFKKDAPINAVNQLLPIDANGRFWVPVVQPQSGQIFSSFLLPTSVPIDNWDSFTFDNHQNIWIREKNGQVFKFDFEKQKLEAKKAFDFNRYQLKRKFFEDGEGITWIPHKFGITKIKKRRHYFENLLNDVDHWSGLPPKGVETYTIKEDGQGILYFFGNELYKLRPGSREIEKAPWQNGSGFPSLPFGFHPELAGASDCRVILGSDGCFWFNWGAEHGLYKYYPESGKYFRFKYDNIIQTNGLFPTAIQEGYNHRIWLTHGRLAFFDYDNERFSADSSLQYSDYVSALLRDGSTMWSVTEKGLLKTDLNTGSTQLFKLFSDTLQILKEDIFTIVAFQGSLWMGTRNGLLKFEPYNSKITVYTTSDGLPHNIIYTVLADGHNLWMGTHNGLSRFNIHTLAIKNYFVEDGLTHNEFNREAVCKARDGKIYFGGMNGVNAFYPAVLDSLSKLESSRLVWTGFSKLDRETDKMFSLSDQQLDTAAITNLQYGDKSFTFRFALLNLTDPSENKYYHLLEGFDEGWTYNENVSFVNYPSLPPGDYTLRVKAIDSHGNSGQNKLAIPIKVHGPWWYAWWFWGLFMIVLAAIILGIRQYERRRIFDHAEAKRLKELDVLKSKLYSNITHEFRTPLTVIIGMTDNINGHEQERKLIGRNSKKLLQLVNQMLDLSKFDQGAMVLQMGQADIISYLNYLTESFYSMAKGKGINLNFYSEEPELVMDFDESKLQHVIFNLLSNAIKFTGAGGSVMLNVYKSNLNGQSQLQIDVRDTGIGIASENLSRIFDRFYQVDDSHTRARGGTGIGLALTKEYVELMGGEISVVSTMGEGSNFTVILPISNKTPMVSHEVLHKEHGDTISLEVEVLAGATQGEMPLTKMNDIVSDEPILLIVEDNKDVALYIHSIVENDYQVITASDGRAGYEKAIEVVPDIIISDVMMPEMDGFTLTDHLKNDERTSHIPIILLTAKAEEQDRLMGLRAGADAYLTKPFNKEEMLIRLEKLTALRKALQLRYTDVMKPISPASDASPSIEDVFLEKAREVIVENIADVDFTVVHFCRSLQMSQPQLYRKLMALTGKSPSHFIRLIRLQKAAELLQTTQLNVSEIAWETGFSDPSYFTRAFHQEFGESPSKWRK